MKVSELAREAGVSAKTVRFYEAEGVLPRAARGPNRYRDYHNEDLCRLRLVVALRGLGLDLAESGRMAGLCIDGRCEEMAGDLLERVARRRGEIAAAKAKLDHLDSELEALMRALETGAPQPRLCLEAVPGRRFPNVE